MEIITSATFPIASSGILIFNKLILTNWSQSPQYSAHIKAIFKIEVNILGEK